MKHNLPKLKQHRNTGILEFGANTLPSEKPEQQSFLPILNTSPRLDSKTTKIISPLIINKPESSINKNLKSKEIRANSNVGMIKSEVR